MITHQADILGHRRPTTAADEANPPPPIATPGSRLKAWTGADSAPGTLTILCRFLIVVALYSVPAATVLRPLDEFDTWWHLRTGQWIAEHRAVPQTDLYAAVLEGQPWIAYSWLFELLLYGLYHGFGLGGIVIYRVVLTLVLVAVLHHFVAKREPRFAVAAGLLTAALAALTPMLCERPWLFTVVFFTLTLDAILDLRRGTAGRAVWLLPLGYVLWANLHIEFVFGLLALGLACVGPVIDALLGRQSRDDHANTAGSRDWWKLVGLSAACLVATLVNPYGVRLYGVVVELTTWSAGLHLVGELQAMAFRSCWEWAVLGLAGAAVFTLGRRPRLDAFEVLLMVAAAYVAFRCRRDIWFLVLVSLAVLLTAPRPAPAPAERFALTPRRALFVGLGVSAVLIILCLRYDCSERGLAERVAAHFPVEAAAVVEKEGYPGPLYNQADWGSYLLWRLPQYPVAIDGRLHMYGDERAYRFYLTGEGRPGWETDPDLTAARLVILRPQLPLAALLRRDPRFRLAHEDPVAVVFVARPEESGVRGP
ncbi:MAG TPA: hypothetical protein VNK04_15980 [Gemmataceae bacterium]|nr:hypothetical protein [Gemmataceae bacterium]